MRFEKRGEKDEKKVKHVSSENERLRGCLQKRSSY